MASPIARRLRANLTEAEKRLWSKLRRKQLEGAHFRRQRPIASYVVDFYCHEARLIIEVDGGQHADQVAQDLARTRDLKELGFHVIRFWNNEIFENIEGVLERIRENLPKR
jgi:very-short-patch-repair endonuclease